MTNWLRSNGLWLYLLKGKTFELNYYCLNGCRIVYLRLCVSVINCWTMEKLCTRKCPIRAAMTNKFSVITFMNQGGKPSHMHTWMQILNPSTSAKPFVTKHQNLFVALVNMDIFHMTLRHIVYSLLTKNDVVDVTPTLLSHIKWCYWLFMSRIPNAKFPPITALLNRSTYKSAKALSSYFMGTPNQWISCLLRASNKCNFCWNIVSAFLCMQTCRMFVDVSSVCTIWLTIKLSLNFQLRPAFGKAPVN